MKNFISRELNNHFISLTLQPTDWVYWMKNEAVRFEGHSYKPESAQTIGLADTIEGRIKSLKAIINWCLKEDIIKKIRLINLMDLNRTAQKLKSLQETKSIIC